MVSDWSAEIPKPAFKGSFHCTRQSPLASIRVNALLPDLGDEVTLQIGVEAYQDKK